MVERKHIFYKSFALDTCFFNEHYPYTYSEALANAHVAAKKLELTEEYLLDLNYKKLDALEVKYLGEDCKVMVCAHTKINEEDKIMESHTGLFLIVKKSFIRVCQNCEPTTYRGYDVLVSKFIDKNKKKLLSLKGGIV